MAGASGGTAPFVRQRALACVSLRLLPAGMCACALPQPGEQAVSPASPPTSPHLPLLPSSTHPAYRSAASHAASPHQSCSRSSGAGRQRQEALTSCTQRPARMPRCVCRGDCLPTTVECLPAYVAVPHPHHTPHPHTPSHLTSSRSRAHQPPPCPTLLLCYYSCRRHSLTLRRRSMPRQRWPTATAPP